MLDVSSFKDLVSKLRRRIEENSQLYNANEAAVRSQLIEPMLEALGWDPSDPQQVVPEDRTEGGPADYCLKVEREKQHRLFVEAKNMSRDPEDGLDELERYCVREGVGYGVSTNGEKWLLFRAFEEDKRRKEKILWEVDIVKDPIPEVFAKLSQVSRENLPELDGRVRQADSVAGLIDRCLQKPSLQIVAGICDAVRNEPEFPELSCTDDELENIVRGRISSIVQRSGAPAIEEEPQYPEQMPHRKPAGKMPRQTPKTISLFGKKIPIRFSYEILLLTANELIRRGKLSAKNVPIHGGRTRYIVNTSPKHSGGNPFSFPKKLSSGLWIETRSIKGNIGWAGRLLEQCGCKASDLQIIE